MAHLPGGAALRAARVLAGAGMLRPHRPDRLLGAVVSLRRDGFGLSAGVAAGAALHPDRPAVVDAAGMLTYRELDDLVNGVAAVLRARGADPGARVGILCRNHLGFVAVVVAAVRLGADVVYLNTGFAGPQLADSVAREGVTLVVHDAELVAAESAGVPRWVVGDVLAAAVAGTARPTAPPRQSRHVILTSGTTGRPKGAARETGGAARDALNLLESLPLRAAQRAMVAAPLFHIWGWAQFSVGLGLGATCVLERTSEPAALLRRMHEADVEVLATVPAVLRRLLDAGPPPSSLRAVLLSGSPLPGAVATRALEVYGDVYNLYGSTEAGWISVAGPEDLRAAPGCAGRPVPGVALSLLDADGRAVAPGEVGRIAVGTGLAVGAYTDGSRPSDDAGLLVTGDLGRLDADGRLFVVGRADDMVVSGGENVYPSEVEELLAARPDVAEVAVVGVPDEDFGQRLRAVVVPAPGATLSADDVRDHVRLELARHKVPRDVLFVDALPRNPAGKVIRSDLVGDVAG